MLIIYFSYFYLKYKMMTNQDSNLTSNSIPPKTWLVESILVTIFCCQILGIISVIYSAGVESKFYRGDIAGAENASRTAKTLVIVSVALGILSVAAIAVMAALGVFASLYNRWPLSKINILQCFCPSSSQVVSFFITFSIRNPVTFCFSAHSSSLRVSIVPDAAVSARSTRLFTGK